ncbi:PEP-CTERM sorting domain-containing protein [Amantichitinum ursilacus]|uniref:PEP-CTERM motif protein n=1 Tax=Amantichitinum ursilacus TaxID=857265 RepID=A0A0N0XHD6_9NEIS|nr:PEP-CTERM sorting domain-containing protein [Amantichitinum ursilacus]KPC51351.1 hypothetical protein WG78_15650 [Amantichitinum ursilacus]
MLTRSLFVSIAMWGAAQAASGSSITTVAGAVGGLGNGDINAGCTTYGPPASTGHFFGSDAFGVPVGGISACGYKGQVVEHSVASGNVSSSANVSGAVLTLGASPAVYNGSGEAHASYTSVGVQAHGAITGGELATNPTDTFTSIGAAITQDKMTISNASLDGQLGYVSYVYSIDGSLSAPGVAGAYEWGYASANFGVDFNGIYYTRLFQGQVYRGQDGVAKNLGNDASGFATGTGLIDGAQTFSTADVFSPTGFAFTFGDAFEYGIGLQAVSYGTADADFASTVKLVGIDVYDSQGHLLTDYSLTSESGTDYLAAAVPEPHEWILLGLGALAVAMARKRSAAASPRPDAAVAIG